MNVGKQATGIGYTNALIYNNDNITNSMYEYNIKLLHQKLSGFGQ